MKHIIIVINHQFNLHTHQREIKTMKLLEKNSSNHPLWKSHDCMIFVSYL